MHNSNPANKYLYNGKELQDNTGYYDYGFRQLDPALGRWFVQDALAERFSGESPYAYVNNNPVNLFDILGLTSWGYINNVINTLVDSDYGRTWSPGEDIWEFSSNEEAENYALGNGFYDPSVLGGSGGGYLLKDSKAMYGKFWQSWVGKVLMRLAGWHASDWVGNGYQWYTKDRSDYYYKNTESNNLMIILADDADFAGSIDRSDLNDSNWDYVITDSFHSADEHISNSYNSSHTFDNVLIRTHGYAMYGGVIDVPNSDFREVNIREQDFAFPGRTYRNYSEAQSLLSISSHFNSSTNVIFGTCFIGNDTDYMSFLQSELGNINLYATVGSSHVFYKVTRNGKLVNRKLNFIRSITLNESYFIHFPSFVRFNIEINFNGFTFSIH